MGTAKRPKESRGDFVSPLHHRHPGFWDQKLSLRLALTKARRNTWGPALPRQLRKSQEKGIRLIYTGISHLEPRPLLLTSLEVITSRLSLKTWVLWPQTSPRHVDLPLPFPKGKGGHALLLLPSNLRPRKSRFFIYSMSSTGSCLFWQV